MAHSPAWMIHDEKSCKYHHFQWQGSNDQTKLQNAWWYILSTSPNFPRIAADTHKKSEFLSEVFHPDDIYLGKCPWIIDSIIYSFCPNKPKGYQSPFNYRGLPPFKSLNDLDQETKHLSRVKSTSSRIKPVATNKVQCFMNRAFSVVSSVHPKGQKLIKRWTPSTQPNLNPNPQPEPEPEPQTPQTSNPIDHHETTVNVIDSTSSLPIASNNIKPSSTVSIRSSLSVPLPNKNAFSVNPFAPLLSLDHSPSFAKPVELQVGHQTNSEPYKFGTGQTKYHPYPRKQIPKSRNHKKTTTLTTNEPPPPPTPTASATASPPATETESLRVLSEPATIETIQAETQRHLSQGRQFFLDLLTTRQQQQSQPTWIESGFLDPQRQVSVFWNDWHDLQKKYVSALMEHQEQLTTSLSNRSITNEHVEYDFSCFTNAIKTQILPKIFQVLDQLVQDFKYQRPNRTYQHEHQYKHEYKSPSQPTLHTPYTLALQRYTNQTSTNISSSHESDQTTLGYDGDAEEVADDKFVEEATQFSTEPISTQSRQTLWHKVSFNNANKTQIDDTFTTLEEIRHFLDHTAEFWQRYIINKAPISIQVELDQKFDLPQDIKIQLCQKSKRSQQISILPESEIVGLVDAKISSLKKDLIPQIVAELFTLNPPLTPNLNNTALSLANRSTTLWQNFLDIIQNEWFFPHLKHGIQQIILKKNLTQLLIAQL
jgi:hypothetical protein